MRTLVVTLVATCLVASCAPLGEGKDSTTYASVGPASRLVAASRVIQRRQFFVMEVVVAREQCDGSPRTCQRTPVPNLRVDVAPVLRTSPPILIGQTDNRGLVETVIDPERVDASARYRIFVDGINLGAADGLEVLRQSRSVENGPEQAAGSTLVPPPTSDTSMGRLPVELPSTLEAMRESRERALQRLAQYGGLSPEETGQFADRVSRTLVGHVSRRQTGVHVQTAMRLDARGVQPSMEAIETVLSGGLTVYALELYFEQIDPLVCTTYFGLNMVDCEALKAAATGIPRSQANDVNPDTLVRELTDARVEMASELVRALNAALASNESLGLLPDRTRLHLVNRCPSTREGDATANLLAWHRGATPDLARCLVRAAGGHVQAIRDALFPGAPLPLVRQFVDWATRGE